MDINDLPDNFTYFNVNEANLNSEGFCVRIKEVINEETALKWIAALQEKSHVTWRITNTIRDEGRINVFKQFRQCQHARCKKVRGVRTSKSTGCPAKMQITVQKEIRKSRSKIKERYMADWPTLVVFRETHNHSTSSASILRFRDMSETTRQKLCSLFCHGHSPASALHCIKKDLLLEHGDSYDVYASDGHYVPSLSVITKLFTKEFQMDWGHQRQEDSSTDVHLNMDSLESFNSVTGNINETKTEPFSADNIARFEQLVSRIRQGLLDSPEKFGPVVCHVLDNCDKYATTETGLLTALHTFSKCFTLETDHHSLRPLENKSRGVLTGVQSTTVGRRRHTLSRKRKRSAGLPSGTSITSPS